MRHHLCVLAFGVCFVPGIVLAQTNALPFGLEKFRFGMGEAEAAALYPGLGPMAPPDSTLSNMRIVSFTPVRWQGCELEVDFHYASVNGAHVLAEVHVTVLNATGFYRERMPPTRCPQAMRESLMASYGPGTPSPPGGFTTDNWQETGTRPRIRFLFSGDLGDAFLHGPGMPGRIFYDTIGPGGTFGEAQQDWARLQSLAGELCKTQRPEDYAQASYWSMSRNGQQWEIANTRNDKVHLRVKGDFGKPDPMICERLN